MAWRKEGDRGSAACIACCHERLLELPSVLAFQVDEEAFLAMLQDYLRIKQQEKANEENTKQ